MKLVRYGDDGQERPGLLDADGTLRDLSGAVGDITGDTLSPAALDTLRALDPAALPAVAGQPRLGPPVGGIGKIVCIGKNYADHAAEMNSTLPDHPMIFMKATSALCGPTDDILLPRRSTHTDWEVELAVVIGTRASYVEEADALSHVAGYATFCDVSERDFQYNHSGQYTKGKSADTFGPLGPWMVTADEVPDPQALSLWTAVEGQRMQDGSTETMIFGVAHLIAHLSQFMTLHPGDIVATGTPDGVGAGRKPPRFLTEGETLELGVDGLGAQRHRIAQA